MTDPSQPKALERTPQNFGHAPFYCDCGEELFDDSGCNACEDAAGRAMMEIAHAALTIIATSATSSFATDSQLAQDALHRMKAADVGERTLRGL